MTYSARFCLALWFGVTIGFVVSNPLNSLDEDLPPVTDLRVALGASERILSGIDTNGDDLRISNESSISLNVSEARAFLSQLESNIVTGGDYFEEGDDLNSLATGIDFNDGLGVPGIELDQNELVLEEAENFTIGIEEKLEKIQNQLQILQRAIENNETLLYVPDQCRTDNNQSMYSTQGFLAAVTEFIVETMGNVAIASDRVNETISDLRDELESDDQDDDPRLDLYDRYELLSSSLSYQKSTLGFYMELLDAMQETAETDPDTNVEEPYANTTPFNVDDNNGQFDLENAESYVTEINNKIITLERLLEHMKGSLLTMNLETVYLPEDLRINGQSTVSFESFTNRVIESAANVSFFASSCKENVEVEIERLEDEIYSNPQDADVRLELLNQFQSVSTSISQQQVKIRSLVNATESMMVAHEDAEARISEEDEEDDLEIEDPSLSISTDPPTTDEMTNVDDEDQSSRDPDEYYQETNAPGGMDYYGGNLNLPAILNVTSRIEFDVQEIQRLANLATETQERGQEMVYDVNDPQIVREGVSISVEDLYDRIEDGIEACMDQVEFIQDRVEDKLAFLNSTSSLIEPNEDYSDVNYDEFEQYSRDELVEIFMNINNELSDVWETLSNLMQRIETQRSVVIPDEFEDANLTNPSINIDDNLNSDFQQNVPRNTLNIAELLGGGLNGDDSSDTDDIDFGTLLNSVTTLSNATSTDLNTDPFQPGEEEVLLNANDNDDVNSENNRGNANQDEENVDEIDERNEILNIISDLELEDQHDADDENPASPNIDFLNSNDLLDLNGDGVDPTPVDVSEEEDRNNFFYNLLNPTQTNNISPESLEELLQESALMQLSSDLLRDLRAILPGLNISNLEETYQIIEEILNESTDEPYPEGDYENEDDEYYNLATTGSDNGVSIQPNANLQPQIVMDDEYESSPMSLFAIILIAIFTLAMLLAVLVITLYRRYPRRMNLRSVPYKEMQDDNAMPQQLANNVYTIEA